MERRLDASLPTNSIQRERAFAASVVCVGPSGPTFSGMREEDATVAYGRVPSRVCEAGLMF